MSSSTVTDAQVRAHAARQLQRASMQVPISYIRELKEHLKKYPADTKFTILPSPGRAYGTVTCLEPGCRRAQFRLTADKNLHDGGLSVGIGGLSAYSVHCSNSHRRPANAPSVGTSSSTSGLRPNTMSTNGLRTSLSKIEDDMDDRKPKLESFDGRLTREVIEIDDDDEVIDLTNDDFAPPPRKKAKIEVRPDRGPFGDLRNIAPSVRASSPGPSGISPSSSLSPRRWQQVLDSILKEKKDVEARISELRRKVLRGDKAAMRLLKDAEIGLAGFEREERDARRSLAASSRPLSSPSQRAPMRNGVKKEENASDDELDIVAPHLIAGPSRPAQPAPRMPKPEDVPPPPFQYHPASQAGPLPVAPVQAYAAPIPGAPVPHGVPYGLPQGYPLAPNPFAQAAQMAQGFVHNIGAGLQAGANAVQAAIARIPAADPLFDAMNAVAGPGARRLFGGDGDDSDDDDEQPFVPGLYNMGGVGVHDPQALNRFILAAGNAEAFDENVTVQDALKVLGLRDQQQYLAGMEITLLPHQLIGVAWMYDHETSDKIKHYGGILADEMGLGKTIQLIALMLKNPPEEGSDRKTTLIVAPLALLDQWKREIEEKTNEGLLSVHVYHGSNSRKAKTKKALQSYDVVLTTFQTLAMEYPQSLMGGKKKKRKNDDFIESDDDAKIKSTAGKLFQVQWYRVVLDEAQNIRNKATRVSQAIADIRATYRWCLTGTPIVNGLADAYPYIRFLRIRPFHEWPEYNQHVVKLEKRQPDLASQRAQGILQTCLLRRMKASQLDGKPLIQLPPKEVVLTALHFTPDERQVYDFIEGKAQMTFNRFLRAGTVLKNYHFILVMLLRLRQICSHPALIQENDGVHLMQAGDEDKEQKDELYRAIRLVGPSFVDQVKAKLLQTMAERVQKEKESLDAEVEDDSCAICFDNYTDPVVTCCQHIYCKDCVLKLFERANDENSDLRADQRPCPSCRQPITEELLFMRSAFEPSDDDLANLIGRPSVKGEVDSDDDLPSDDDIFGLKSPKKNQKKGKSSPKLGKSKREKREKSLWNDESDDSMDDFIVDDDEDEEEKDRRKAKKIRKGKRRAVVLDSDEEMPGVSEAEESDADVKPDTRPKKAMRKEDLPQMSKFLPSTKKMMELLKAWGESDPTDKVMIISQWTSCLELVANYLDENDISYVRYQGSMSKTERDDAVTQFQRERGGARVMLMSLKAGGVGLNLTRGNRVINLDLGWSEAVEHQAFDRVHRLGQKKDVLITRLIIENTVEDRIIALQARKKALADGSLGEGTGRKMGRLSVRELANLFGINP